MMVHSLLLCVLLLVSVCQCFLLIHDAPRRVVKTLSVRNGDSWGDWGDLDFCADGTFAVGYDMKIEPNQHGGDDTSLNGIKLRCESLDEATFGGDITSAVSPWGPWVGLTRCDYDPQTGDHHFLTAFALQVESSQGGNGDDTAANYVKFKCRDYESKTQQYDMVRSPGVGLFGTFGSFSESCPAHSAICGLRTLVESDQHGGDDTALNDVIMYCCETH